MSLIEIMLWTAAHWLSCIYRLLVNPDHQDPLSVQEAAIGCLCSLCERCDAQGLSSTLGLLINIRLERLVQKGPTLESSFQSP